MGPEFRRINAIKQSRRARVFADLQKILNDVGVEMISKIIEVLNVRVVVESGVAVTATEFMAPDMVHRFLLGSVLVDLPGEKLVEDVARQARAREQIIAPGSRLWKHFRLI